MEEESNKENKKTPEMLSKEAYFEELRVWMEQSRIYYNLLSCFPYYLMANYPQLFESIQTQSNVSPFSTDSPKCDTKTSENLNTRNTNEGPRDHSTTPDRIFSGVDPEEIINWNGGYEYVIASFWKRVVAEVIDVAILLLIKIIVTYTVVNILGLDFGFEFDKEFLKKSLEDDYDIFIIPSDLLSFSSDLLVLELLTKVVICVYEALWTMRSSMHIGGATPGKLFMGLRVLYVEAVHPLQPAPAELNFRNQRTSDRALLYPAANPGFRRALLRAIAKNILMALFFPICVIMLFFKNNRTVYDIMTKTIVVEENPAPVFRRR